MNDTLSGFVIDNNVNEIALDDEILGPQTNSCSKNFQTIDNGENRTCQNQVLERNIENKIRKVDDKNVMFVENRAHDMILTALDNIAFLRDEMAVRSITGSSGQGSTSVVQNNDRRDFTVNTENTQQVSASVWVGLNADQSRNGGTSNVGNFDDGDFQVIRLNYDRQAHAHCTFQVRSTKQSYRGVKLIKICKVSENYAPKKTKPVTTTAGFNDHKYSPSVVTNAWKCLIAPNFIKLNPDVLILPKNHHFC